MASGLDMMVYVVVDLGQCNSREGGCTSMLFGLWTRSGI